MTSTIIILIIIVVLLVICIYLICLNHDKKYESWRKYNVDMRIKFDDAERMLEETRKTELQALRKLSVLKESIGLDRYDRETSHIV